MTIVIITIKKDNDETEIVYHNVPFEVYKEYAKQLSGFEFVMYHLKNNDSMYQVTKVHEVEAKFNDFLHNIHKKIDGCYEIFPNVKEMDFTTPVKTTIEV
jgi:hypothetical protein